MTPLEEFARHSRTWSRQTIIFALQYSLRRPRNAVEEQAQVVRVSDESAEIMDRLWATAELGSTDLSQTIHRYIRLVFEWCSEHGPGKGNPALN
jgi:hypothetical protein